MGWLSQQPGLLVLYAESVGYYFLAIMAGVVFVVSDYAEWLAPALRRRIDSFIPPHARRPLEIAIMVVVVFIAGFSAWQDQLGQTKSATSERDTARELDARHLAQANERLHEIAGKGGLTDQIAALQAKLAAALNQPPRVITEKVPVPIPGAAPQTRDRSSFIGPLQKFYDDGGKIQGLLSSTSLSDDQIDQIVTAALTWFDSTSAWINQHMGAAAARRFGNNSDKPSYTYDLAGSHKDGEKQRRDVMLNALAGCLTNLETLLRSDEFDPPQNH